MDILAPLKRLLQKKWAVLIAWQVISLFLCLGATICSFIATYYATTIPLMMMAIGYTLLLCISCWRVPKTEIAFWRYSIVAILLVAGDYTGIQAYNMTSLASALLFVTTVSFWTAPVAWVILKRKITVVQFFAILLGMCGSVMVFIADGTEGNRWVGNILALISAITYAIGTVLQELLVHCDSIHIYLFRVALTASPISIILTSSLEWKTMRDFEWTWQSVLMTLSYSVILVIYYCASPFVMQFSDATTMNLSMLTSNFYSLAISILAFGQKASWLYLVGFFCIPIAIALFTVFAPKPPEAKKGESYESSDIENKDQTYDQSDINSVKNSSSSDSTSEAPNTESSTTRSTSA
ncbi:Integral membrane protein [Tritrichomonas foetus]|uniref:Integral membrane protein n=1 Tax=Tritrichomonas foetus TaxID=1144522 RepID=A0A1J4KV34_9EUKA|nr:Integral membrane protein [Tritrichomonas foetus]|eukprot:OHT13365.1 Integral membrane protein [Tritrichomonas foetus]